MSNNEEIDNHDRAGDGEELGYYEAVGRAVVNPPLPEPVALPSPRVGAIDRQVFLFKHLFGPNPTRINSEKSCVAIGSDEINDRILGHLTGSPFGGRIAPYDGWVEDGERVTMWAGVDIDGGSDHGYPVADVEQALASVRAALDQVLIPYVIEISKSGKGRHVWLWFDEPVKCWQARSLLLSLIESTPPIPLAAGPKQELADAEKNRGLEVFPKTISGDGPGNSLFLPLYHGDMGPCSRIIYPEIDWSAEKPIDLIPAADICDTLQMIRSGGGDVKYVDLEPRPAKPTAAITQAVGGGSATWTDWRKNALAVPDLLQKIYGDRLTGKVTNGWLQATIDDDDRTPSAGVCDAGDAERGSWHDFREDKTISIFDWLISTGQVKSFRHACQLVSQLSGVPLPVKPEIVVEGQINDLKDEAWDALLQERADLFLNFRKKLVRYDPEAATTATSLVEVDKDEMLALLLESAAWFTPKGKDRDLVASKGVPPALVNQVIRRPDTRVRRIARIVRHPIVVGDRILFKDGYDKESEILLENCPEINLPEQVTADDASAAAASILKDIYGDFPFDLDASGGVGDGADVSASRAHVLLIPLSGILRYITGIIPPFVITSSAPGSGKGLLCDVSMSILDIRASGSPPVKDPDEQRKRIESQMIAGESVIKLDNLNGGLYSSFLASTWTMEYPEFRLLGSNTMVKCRNWALWLVNGINCEMSNENARRPVYIRLVPTEENPSERKDLTRNEEQLLEFARQNRADLISKLLIMVKYWIQQGMPVGSYGFGSFNKWAGILGKILELACVPGFLGNRATMIEDSDGETRERRALVEVWHSQRAGGRQSPADLAELCEQHNLLTSLLGKGPFADERKRAASMGYWLRGNKDRVVSIEVEGKKIFYYIRKERKGNNPYYYLELPKAK